MRSIFLLATLFLAGAATAQERVWTQSLPSGGSVNTNRVGYAARLPDGNVVVDIGRMSLRFEMTVMAADSGAITTTRRSDHPAGFDSSSIATSTGDFIRYAITAIGPQTAGRLSSIDTQTGELNWELVDQPLRNELNTDDAGHVYVLEFTGIAGSAPLQLKSYNQAGAGRPIGLMASGNAVVVPLAQVNGLPGWVVSSGNGYQSCRLGGPIDCTALQLPAPTSVVRKIQAAPDGGFYVETLDFGTGVRFGLSRFSAAGARLWHQPISNQAFGWDAVAAGVALMLGDDPNCSAGQLGLRTLKLDGAPDALALCLESHEFTAESARFVDLGTHWALKHSVNTTPRIIDKANGHAYWLRLGPNYGQTVAYADLVPLADGEFVAVSIDWLEQWSERIHARRLRLVDTLFRDNYEYLAR